MRSHGPTRSSSASRRPARDRGCGKSVAGRPAATGCSQRPPTRLRRSAHNADDDREQPLSVPQLPARLRSGVPRLPQAVVLGQLSSSHSPHRVRCWAGAFPTRSWSCSTFRVRARAAVPRPTPFPSVPLDESRPRTLMQIDGLQNYGVNRFQLASATIGELRVLTPADVDRGRLPLPLRGGLALLVGLVAWAATRVALRGPRTRLPAPAHHSYTRVATDPATSEPPDVARPGVREHHSVQT